MPTANPRPGLLSPLLRLYHKYLSLRLPWRRRWLAGTDLANNKYYYFRPTLSSTFRPRRLLQPAPSSSNSHSSTQIGRGDGGRLASFADIKIPVQWHQWLRYTREDPPSVEELVMDEQRKERMTLLAEQANRRWEEQGRIASGNNGANAAGQNLIGEGRGEKKEDAKSKEAWQRRERGAPGEGWQPEAWSPSGTTPTRETR